jgi:hypothetical protein
VLYKVAKFSGVDQQIVALVEQATAVGIRQIVIDALKEMVLHLQTHPLHWGDPEFNANLPGGVVCRAILDPIIVRYMVFEEQHVVFIRDVKPLPGSLFERK